VIESGMAPTAVSSWKLYGSWYCPKNTRSSWSDFSRDLYCTSIRF